MKPTPPKPAPPTAARKQNAAVSATTDATPVLPPALEPLRSALAALSGLRARLAQIEAAIASATSQAAEAQRQAEDRLAAGADASEALAAAARHCDAAAAARAEAAGLRRRIAQAEADLPGAAAEGRQALHAFAQDVLNRLDGRYRKSLGQMLTLLGEAAALRWSMGLGDGAHLLGQVRLPTSLADLTQPWRIVGSGLGDAPAQPSDAGVQLAEAARLLAVAERIASDARWRRDQAEAA